MKGSKVVASLSFSALLVTGTVCSGQARHEQLLPRAQRRRAADFSVVDLAGNRFSLSAQKGRVVLLDFWAVNCGGCKLEIPWYVAFDQQYRPAGLSLIGLDMYGESPDVIRRFAQEQKVRYPPCTRNRRDGSKVRSWGYAVNRSDRSERSDSNVLLRRGGSARI